MKIIQSIFLLLKNLSKSNFVFIRRHYKNAILQKRNPTCKIYPSCNISNTKLHDRIVIFDNVALMNCDIGRHTYIQKNSRIFNCKIGSFCSIASNVSIAPGLHKTTGVSTHPSFYLKNTPLAVTFATRDFMKPSKEVLIDHDVWIGENSIILDGISIGAGAIIAAGSVVTKDVDSYSIVGGIPARHVKYRFEKQTVKFLQESQWWNFSDKWFEENFECMFDFKKFKEKIQCLSQKS